MSEESVRVVVRCRPLNGREKAMNCGVVVQTVTEAGQVQLARPGAGGDAEPPKKFTFDGAYGMDSNSQMIYEDLGFPLIESVLDGYNGTVFAYGQTGCGKSFTMEGIPDPPEHRGLTPRSFEHIFQEVAVRENTKFLVRVSYLEIYNENVRDLLGSDQTAKLELKEHPDRGVYVRDLSEHVVHNTTDVLKLMAMGSKHRSVGATLMNADSSRSHSIFTVWLEACEAGEEGGEEKLRASKLNLVDLAGSERQGKTGATGDRLKEATKINLSLSALGNVISALVDGKAKHIPYRDSKLTRLLQDSLGGNTKTLMVAAISPADNNYDETLSTLRYANRAKNIKNKAIINEDPKDALLRQYQEEINQLKALLSGQLGMDPAAALAALSAAGAAAGKPAARRTSGAAASTALPPVAAPAVAAAPPPPVAAAAPVAPVVDEAALARARAEQEAAFKVQEETLKREYDAQLASLQQAYEEQRMTNEKLEQEFERLTQEYNIKRDDARTHTNEVLAEVAAQVAVGQVEAVSAAAVASGAVTDAVLAVTAATSAASGSGKADTPALASLQATPNATASVAVAGPGSVAPAKDDGADATTVAVANGLAAREAAGAAAIARAAAAASSRRSSSAATHNVAPDEAPSATATAAAMTAPAAPVGGGAEPIRGADTVHAALMATGPSDLPPAPQTPVEAQDVTATAAPGGAPLAAAAKTPTAPAPQLDIVPEIYIVVDASGKAQMAVRQAGSHSFYATCVGEDSLLHPSMPNGDGRPYRIRDAQLAVCAADVGAVAQHPPKVVVAVGEGGVPLPALLGPEGAPAAPTLTAWRGLEATVRDEDGELELVTGHDGLPVAVVELSEDATVVVNRDGQPQVVLVTAEGLPVRAVLDANGQLVPQLRNSSSNAEEEQDEEGSSRAAQGVQPVLGPDGLAAQPIVGRLPCKRIRPRPVAVMDSQGQPVVALLSADGVPVQAVQDATTHAFVPVLGEDGKPVPVAGSEGLLRLDDTMVDPARRQQSEAAAAATMAAAAAAVAGSGQPGERLAATGRLDATRGPHWAVLDKRAGGGWV